MFQTYADKNLQNCVMNNYYSTVNESTYVIGTSDTLYVRFYIMSTNLSYVVNFHDNNATVYINKNPKPWWYNITTDAIQILHFTIYDYDRNMLLNNIKINNTSLKNGKFDFVSEKILYYYGVTKIEILGKHALCKTPEKVTFIQNSKEPIPLNVNQVQYFSNNNTKAYLNFNHEYHFDVKDIESVSVTRLYDHMYNYSITQNCILKMYCTFYFQYASHNNYPDFSVSHLYDEDVIIDYYFATNTYHIRNFFNNTIHLIVKNINTYVRNVTHNNTINNNTVSTINLISKNVIKISNDYKVILILMVFLIFLMIFCFYLIFMNLQKINRRTIQKRQCSQA